MRLLYSRDHIWVAPSGTRARIGISDFAQSELGDIAYVELPAPGLAVSRGEVACTVDSLKSSSEIYAPVSGIVVEANIALASEHSCGLINSDPLGEGWIFVLELSDRRELDLLLSEEEYASYISGK